MALRALIKFDDSALILRDLLENKTDDCAKSIEFDPRSEFNRTLMRGVEKFGHFRHDIWNVEQSEFRGTAIDALIKLDYIYKARHDSEEWFVFINDSNSFLYDPALHQELVDKFPE